MCTVNISSTNIVLLFGIHNPEVKNDFYPK